MHVDDIDISTAATTWQQWFAHAPDGLLLLDAALVVRHCNDRGLELLQRDRSAVIGVHISTLLSAGEATRLLADLVDPANAPSQAPYLVPYGEGATRRQLSVSLARATGGDGPAYLLCVRDETATFVQHRQRQRLSQAMEHTDSAVILCAPSGLIEYVNEGFCRMFGHTAEKVLGVSPIELLGGPHSDAPTLSLLSTQHFAGRSHHADALAYRSDGHPLWVSVTTTPVDAHAAGHGTIVVLDNITASKTRERLYDTVLDALVRDAPLTDTLTLICREIEKAVPALRVSISRANDDNLLVLAAPSLPAAYVAALDGARLGSASAPCGLVARRGRALQVDGIANDAHMGRHHEVLQQASIDACTSHPIRSTSGQVLGALTFYMAQAEQASDWHQQLAELSVHLAALALERDTTRLRMHQLAFYDALTGLPNRMMFNARAEQMMSTARATRQPMALLFIDLDRFKRINETQGHAAADGVLRDLAQRLQTAAGEDALLGRQLGDEFILLLPLSGASQASATCERLLAAIATPLVAGHMTVHASASIGVAMLPEDGRDIDTLLRHADLAMQHCKQRGGGRFHFFSHEMNRVVQEQAALEAALRDAMQHDQLQLHYQPQLCGVTGKLWGVEALLRWTHPHLGPISPARFIPMAEESGLIDAISGWVLRRACRDLARWRASNTAIPRVSVNLSASSFDDPGFPARLHALLTSHGLQPTDLILEITEGVMLSPQPRVLENLEAIRAMGVGLSLDDFGTGYSSLSHLHRLPISELKLDRSFVKDIEHSESARTLITSVLRIGENLRKQVVAEGVETEAQRRFLTEQGCQLLQGFLFSPGLPAGALESWLQQHPPKQ